MKRIFHVILRVIAILSLISIPIAFYFSGTVLSAALDSVLHLKVNPSFSGGEVRARMFDPAGDDMGSGTLVYPLAAKEHPGALDIIRYTVYEPQVNAYSAEYAPYWQIAVTLAGMPDPQSAPLGFSYPVVMIYIDTDGPGSGSVETAVPRAELISFDPEHPWDVCVEIDGWHPSALLRTASGSLERRVPVIAVPAKSTVYVRLPLDIPELERILDNRTTWHYVFTAAYDSLSRGFIMPLAAQATQRSGGGASSGLTPRIYDCLSPRGKTQTGMLSSWDERAFTYAVISPMEISRIRSAPVVNLDMLKAKMDEERGQAQEAERTRAEAALENSEGESRVALLFTLGRNEETEALIKSLTTTRGDTAILLAYEASLQAKKAGQSDDAAEQMNLVHGAFALFEKSESLCRTDEDRVTLYLNRGYVAMSIPESVFKKSLAGAHDFLDAEEILNKKQTDAGPVQTALICAMRCFERAGNNDEAVNALVRAASLKPVLAETRYECARLGIELE
jgi:hypothetical protein